MLKKVLLTAVLLNLSEIVFAPSCWDILNPNCWDIFNSRGTTETSTQALQPDPIVSSPAPRAQYQTNISYIPCPACTLLNDPSRSECEICNTPLQQAPATSRAPRVSPPRTTPITMCEVCGTRQVYVNNGIASRKCSITCQASLSTRAAPSRRQSPPRQLREPAQATRAQVQLNSTDLQYLTGTNISGQQVPFYTFWHTQDLWDRQDHSIDPLYPRSANPKDMNQCFSNWYLRPFSMIIEGQTIKFPTSEHAIMFYKVLHNTKDINTAQRTILYSDTPHSVKGKARGFYIPSWDAAKIGYAQLILTAKFKQNPDLMALLKSTRNGILVEASPYDKEWGVGLAQNNPAILNQLTWKGRNILGEALMFVRDNN